MLYEAKPCAFIRHRGDIGDWSVAVVACGKGLGRVWRGTAMLGGAAPRDRRRSHPANYVRITGARSKWRRAAPLATHAVVGVSYLGDSMPQNMTSLPNSNWWALRSVRAARSAVGAE